MNKFEFNEIMNTEEFYNTHRYIECNGNSENLYIYEGLRINYSGTYYAIVEGMIPKEVAYKLYELDKTGEKYDIRYHGGVRGTDVTNESCDYIYYHVDTVEGLILLIEVYKQYLNGTLDEEVDISNVLRTVENNMIQSLYSVNKINESNTEWVNRNNFYKEIYNNTVDTRNYELLKYFRDRIDEFDKTVNPFIGEEYEYVTSNIDFSKLIVTAYGDQGRTRFFMRNGKNIDEIRKDDQGYFYTNQFTNEKGDSYSCNHFFIKSMDGKKANEVIRFIKHANYKIDGSDYEFSFDLTNNEFVYNDGHKGPITLDIAAFIYDELGRYIQKAKEVYSDTLTEENNKKLV